MTGDIVWNVGPGATETTGRAKYSMFVLRCFDVAATLPAQPSPAIHLSLSALSDGIYFSSTLNIFEFECWVYDYCG